MAQVDGLEGLAAKEHVLGQSRQLVALQVHFGQARHVVEGGVAQLLQPVVLQVEALDLVHVDQVSQRVRL